MKSSAGEAGGILESWYEARSGRYLVGIISSRWDLPGLKLIPSPLVSGSSPQELPLHPLCLRLDPGSPSCPRNLRYQEFHASCPKIPRRGFIIFVNIFINISVDSPLIFLLFLFLFPPFPKLFWGWR